jgi:uncharacterized membrane protein
MQMFESRSAWPDLEAPYDETGESRREVVGSFVTYADAQHAVDRLSDALFPVQYANIVGHDLRLVERVSGRMTNARAAAAGAGSGAWFGLLIGLLIGLFAPGPAWLGLMFAGLLMGAGWGALFGYLAHKATRGQRDFASRQALTASAYDVTVPARYAGRARELLSPLS